MKETTLALTFVALITSASSFATNDMALIPAGPFAMGNCMNPGEGDAGELPVHTVYVSAFHMDKTEVTKQLWNDVYTWAVNNGYEFDNTGMCKEVTHPVQTVNWYDCVKWCNARSERDGRIPCYYTSAVQTSVYRKGQISLSSECVRWSVAGYRLPTEAEWEKAARGGTPGHRFPWTNVNTITHSQANYHSRTNETYDINPTTGYHPSFDDGPTPFTSPVGSFAPNGYGLYDMAGNVWEWCWDWYDVWWYSNAASTQDDTRGPASSPDTYRVMRGGTWVYYSVFSRCSFRILYGNPGSASNFFIGFRCVSSADSGMALIPAGPFAMGNCMDPGEGSADQLPLHTVAVSAFYIDRNLVPYALWSNVHAWAVAHGYSFNNQGTGKATNHPVQTVNWYDCVKWCNARSEMDGLTPCYYTSAALTGVYRTGQLDLGNEWVYWHANGYRLPTEAEWEKAARGGTPGHRFPWNDADTVSHDRANYCSTTNIFSYDVSATLGNHPTFATGDNPYTSPVGYFAPNGYGLYDMAGNVYHWTWDHYSSTWYSSADGMQNDTRGPTNGTDRMLRGGDWYSGANTLKCAHRSSGVLPGYAHFVIGFRCVRSLGSVEQTLIPAGSFAMGNCMGSGEGAAEELPVHSVSVSAFYMDTLEVSKQFWGEVYSWAITNGYSFDNAGSGKAATHPVQTVNWYDCVKWCNARSEKEGRMPCYYTDAAQTQICRTGQISLVNDAVKWHADGYRLPTEAEWEKAARGGTPGHRFPWSDTDTISHERANYFATNAYAYDASATLAYHPMFNDGTVPYTSPAGVFAPNGYGLYDMAGNVWEWTWDWHGDTWYGNAGATQNDTRGPTHGMNRVLRGGVWHGLTYNARCTYRNSYGPWIASHYTGFRCIRGLGSPEMALIPAGPFAMGNCMSAGEGNAIELPVHTVMVSAFYLDKFEVTKQFWDEVHAWAITNGYTFDNAGSGKAANHPVQTVSWYDCVKWCNARSEKEGRIPCYYTDASQTQICRIGQISLINNSVKWQANGYRLPTEAEWEKAARGGTPGHRFPWSDADTISHARANYYADTNSFPYDVSITQGHHPTFNDGMMPYTSPAGYFAPNGYGLYDMVGNIIEWTWDWCDGRWYTNAMSVQSDPHGPISGAARILRGTGWYGSSFAARCAARDWYVPSDSFNFMGFRCARGLDTSEMATIPAGPFAMGDTFAEGQPAELPVHTVSVSAFHLDKSEVTKQFWGEVYAWAVTNGYSFDNAGSGKAATHPVQTVNWYDCVKWCNARSEWEGRRPCYYTSAAQTEIYRTGQIVLSNDCVKWAANGYRLPTEAEWEMAARGGTSGHRFPWSDAETISHGRANYYADTNAYTYDISPTLGYHPAFYDGVSPYTGPVACFAPNGYGLHDMAGNVWEWCWDNYDAGWYSNAVATQSDTRGPLGSTPRVLRGGGWIDGGGAYYSRCAYRLSDDLGDTHNGYGFRCARRVEDSMALIPSGAFGMGNDTNLFPEAYAGELPSHSVHVSAFHMDKHEVSYTLWSNVYAWAVGHGYSFDNSGSGKANNHPAHTINWYDCVKWCNARSEMEGRTPCYYTDAAQTQICRVGQISLINDSVNWIADGYRLPTEAEWEKAARGGTPGHRFPWSDTDTISHARANYYADTNSFAYDVSITQGYHPTFNDGMMPYTSPVGYFAPNGYGLYDMAGNLWEWTWDWYDGTWYGSAGATRSDTCGPTNGVRRVLRGGEWFHNSLYTRCASRGGDFPTDSYNNIGFRCVVSSGDQSVPAAPTYVVSSDGSFTNKVEVIWSTSGNATKYSLWRNTSGSTSDAINISGDIAVTNYNDTTVTPGQTYWYWVKAGNAGGWSGFSAGDSGYAGLWDTPTNMSLVPAGAFSMGDTFGEGSSNELPVHSVYVSVFCMDKYEVTHSLWSNVYSWAVGHGYLFDNAGAGKGTNHPVQMVSWYDCVKWCNARSEMEGRVPCYYTDAAQTQICRIGQISLSNECVKWTANGYRLPTEAEWEKAARGGTPGHRFPWSDSDTIQHARANYYSTNWFAYDTSPTSGHHPTFNDVVYPYTSPAGYFVPNVYGLHDMAGNVFEWTWDWYDDAWYPSAGAIQNNTHGPTNGTSRVVRGGDWSGLANNARSAVRGYYTPISTFYYVGFRCVRNFGFSLPQQQAPANVVATDGTYTNKIAIAWATASNATKYAVWRSTASSTNGASNISGDIASTNYDDTAVTPGTTYWYWVKAGNAGGWSGFSTGDSGYAQAGASPVPDIQPTYLDFATNGTAKSFTIANTGGGSFSFANVVSGGTWLSVQPSSGIVSNQAALVVASANRTGMVDGIHTAFISVTPSVGAGVVVTCRMVVAGNSVIAIAGGPYYADQGTAVTLDGSASLGNNLQYRWELGWISPFSAGNVRTNITLYVPGTNDVILYVKETGSMTTYGDQTILVVRNVAPVVDIGGPYTGTVNQTVALRATIADPGTGDTHEVRWDFGAGWSPWQAAGAVALTGAVFASSGSHAVQCEVRDNYGAVGADMATVFVDAPNLPPTARATLGSPGVVYSNYFGMHMTVLLDGSGSVDDRTAATNLYFDWREDVDNPSKPLLSDAARQQSNATITFIPVPGVYRFHLVVNDGEYNSEPATVQANIPGIAGIVKSDGIGAVLPLCGVTLTATNQALGQVFSCVSDYEGKYVLDTGAGNGRMVVMERNGQVHQALANVDSDGMRNYVLTFAPNVGSFSALVNSGYYGGAYAPIPGAYAQVVIGSDVAFSGVGDLSGVVPFGGVPELWPRNNPAYNYQVLYQKPGWQSGVQALQIDPAMPEAQYPTLIPSDACTVQGSVVGTNGMPVRGIEVSFGPAFAPVYSDNQGTFVANGMMRGEYFVRLSASDFETTYRTINVPPGDTNYVVPPLYVRGGRFSVYGEVFNGENGMPIYNAQVRVVSSTKRGTVGTLATTSSVASTRSGYYDLSVAKGARTIVIEASGYEPKTVPVDAQGHVQQPVQLVPIPEPAIAGAAILLCVGASVRRCVGGRSGKK